jgi:rod shape-determining protein MreD
MSFLIFTISTLLLATIQADLPTLGWLGGLRVEFLPALVAYGALTLPRGGALLLALCVGFAQDSLSAAPFGISALSYGITATILSSVRETFDRDLPWVQMSAGALTSAAASFAALCVIGFSIGGLVKLSLLAGLSAVVTVVLSLATDYWLRVTHE